MANLTAEEISHLVMATPPRAFDAQQFQPVVAPPDPQPDPNIPSIQAAAAQPVSADNPSFTVNPNYNTPGQQTFLSEKPAEAQATPPVAIALPQPAQAQQRQFTPVSLPGIEKPSTLDSAAPVAMAQPAPLATQTAPTPLALKTAADQTELARKEKSGSGISQIFHPVDSDGDPDLSKHPGFLRKLGGIAARVGDVAGSMFFPSGMSMIPGTTLHHQLELSQQNGIVGQDLAQQKSQQDLDTQAAAAKVVARNNELVDVKDADGNTFSIPRSQMTTWQTKMASVGQKGTAAELRNNRELAVHGFKSDANGQPIPMEDSELSPLQRSDQGLKKVREDYYGAQQELAKARVEVEKAKNDPNSPAFKMAMENMAIRSRMVDSMQVKNNAYALNATARNLGTDTDHNPLNAAYLLGPDNAPVGSAFSANVNHVLPKAAQFSDVHGAVKSMSSAIDALFASGGSLNSMQMAAALHDTSTPSSAWAQGKVKTSMTSDQINAVVAIKGMRERIMAIRAASGTPAALAMVDKMIATMPDATTASQHESTEKIANFNDLLGRLEKGVPNINTNAAPAQRQPRTGSRAPAINQNTQPNGATMKVPGSDGQMHWSDGTRDMGVAR